MDGLSGPVQALPPHHVDGQGRAGPPQAGRQDGGEGQDQAGRGARGLPGGEGVGSCF